MSIMKCTAFVLTLTCCNSAIAQQTSPQAPDQTRRAERVENRRDQLGVNREERQENRGARQGDRGSDGRTLSIDINSNEGSNLDEFIATCLLMGNEEEVAIAKMQ